MSVSRSERRRRRGAVGGTRILAVAIGLATAVSGCTFRGVASMPLPGGVDTGSDPYDVKIVFENVLDLVPQSQCRVNDVPVGKVVTVGLVNWKAEVTCRLRRSVDLPANAVATISQTSLLGEKYVALSAPRGEPPRGRLTDGSTIPLERTARGTEVEEVLSAMSMLVTGGGLEQISTINHELNAALKGRTVQMRDLIDRVGVFVATLDRQKRQIVDTIDKVDRLTATLARHNQTIADTIDSTAPAVKVLARQRKNLTKLLVNMDRLGIVATRVINRSRDDTAANLRSLQTVLENTDQAASVIPKVLGGLFTFPFPETVDQALKGDYGNLYITLNLDVDDIAHNLLAGTAAQGISTSTDRLEATLPAPRTSFPDTPLGVLPPAGLGGGSDGTGGTGGTQQKGGGGILPPLGMSGTAPGDDLGALLSGGIA